MTPEDKLAALLGADTPRRPDYAFQARVAEKVAQRRLWLSITASLPWALLIGVVLWALAPAVGGLNLDVEPITRILTPLALALLLAGLLVHGSVRLSPVRK